MGKLKKSALPDYYSKEGEDTLTVEYEARRREDKKFGRVYDLAPGEKATRSNKIRKSKTRKLNEEKKKALLDKKRRKQQRKRANKRKKHELEKEQGEPNKKKKQNKNNNKTTKLEQDQQSEEPDAKKRKVEKKKGKQVAAPLTDSNPVEFESIRKGESFTAFNKRLNEEANQVLAKIHRTNKDSSEKRRAYNAQRKKKSRDRKRGVIQINKEEVEYDEDGNITNLSNKRVVREMDDEFGRPEKIGYGDQVNAPPVLKTRPRLKKTKQMMLDAQKAQQKKVAKAEQKRDKYVKNRAYEALREQVRQAYLEQKKSMVLTSTDGASSYL